MRNTITALLLLACFASAKQYEVYNPQITRGYMCPPGELRYNHDSTIEFFQGRFYGSWNGNTDRWENKAGQKNYWAVSDDGLNWSEPIAYQNVPAVGPESRNKEWQPNLLNRDDRELWNFWNKAGGFFFSKLTAEKTGWDHRLVWETVSLFGVPCHTFPTQEPTALQDGSVLVPCVFYQSPDLVKKYDDREYYSGPAITRDNGKTFTVPETALVQHPDPEFKLWEPMYIVQDDGKLRMFNRTKGAGTMSHIMPTNALLTAVGSADGEVMGPMTYSAVRTIAGRMWLGSHGSRKLMVHHDSMCNFYTRDRINIALFSSRTGRDDFVAGIPIEWQMRGIAYPQAVLHDNAAYVCFSHQSDPATIVVNKVEPLPADDKWYIFPRAGNRSLTGNDLPRPVAATATDPAHLEFYAAAYDVKSGPVNAIGTNSITITGWISMRPKNDGVIFNALSEDGTRGFSLRFNYDGKLIFSLGNDKRGQEIFIDGPLQSGEFSYANWRDYSSWFFFGITVNNATGEVWYWKNGELVKAGRTFTPNHDFSSGQVPGFGKPQKQSEAKNHYPLYARVQSVRVYDRLLAPDELAADFGRNKPAEKPRWKLDFDCFQTLEKSHPLSMPVQIDGNVLTFSGNSSAGVDLEKFDPETDALEVTLPVQMDTAPVSESVVLMSMGDNNDIMIGLRRDDPAHVYVNCTGAWEKACAFKIGERNKLLVRMDKQAVTVANGGDSVTVPNSGISQRLYLGDGYPNFYVAPADRFVVDVSQFDAEVIR